MESFAVCDIGKNRDMNQDAVFSGCFPIGNLDNLFIVADGMGGHNAGDYASTYAVGRLHSLMETPEEKSVSLQMQVNYAIINREIFEKGQLNPELSGMGTTLVSCTIDKEYVMTAANVGDSRLYVYHKTGGLRQITRDHSFVEELVRRGQITRDSDLYQQSKNIITRAIGADFDVETDIFQMELEAGDQILLCSDGLTNMVTDDEISDILKCTSSLKEKAEKLVQMANDAGGMDNISVVLVKLPEDSISVSETDSDTEEIEMRGL